MTSPKTPSTLKDDLNYDESYNLNETELNILRSLNPKGHIYNDYISNNIRIKAIRAGFLAGQSSSEQRILGIIEKKKKEVKQKNKDKSLPDLVKANLAGMYIALEELNQDIKSLINSPQENKVGSATESSAEFKDTKLLSIVEPEPLEDKVGENLRKANLASKESKDTSGSSNSNHIKNLVGKVDIKKLTEDLDKAGVFSSSNSNQNVCVCGHRKEVHHKGYSFGLEICIPNLIGNEKCSCSKFRPAKEGVK